MSIELRDLARRLAADGPAAVEDELSELAREAAASGVELLLLAVLCDRRKPDVVRQRAFARVAAELDRLSSPARPDTADEPGLGCPAEWPRLTGQPSS